MKRILGAALLLLLALGLWKWGHRKGAAPKAPVVESPLYSGKEPKLKVKVCFPSSLRPGFTEEAVEIFQTASKSAQLKQSLLALFAGPMAPGADAAFPAGFKYREVFVTDKGLAVIDLDPDSVKLLPGGTSSEFVSLYCLLHSVFDNFKDIRQVQLLVGGESRESLAGHFDISGPLTLQDF